MKPKVKTILMTCALSLGVISIIAPSVRAEDAKSLGMGGTALAVPNGPFSVYVNPALTSKLGWGSFNLPISIDHNMTASAPIGNILDLSLSMAGIKTSGKSFDALLTEYINVLSKSPVFETLPNGLSIKAYPQMNILGYNGKPFGDLKINERPVAFGLNVSAGGAAIFNIGVSPGFTDIMKDIPDFLTAMTDINKQGTDISSKVASDLPKLFTNSVTELQNSLKSVQSMNASTLTSAAGVDSVITTIDNSMASLDKIAGDANSQITSILKPVQDDISKMITILSPLEKEKQYLNLKAVGDGHLTVAFNSSASVYEDQSVKVFAGANVKMFFMPQIASVPSGIGTLSSVGTPDSKYKSLTQSIPMSIDGRIEINKLESLSQAKTTMDAIPASITKAFNDTTSSIKTSVNKVKTDLQDIKTSIPLATDDPATAFAKLNAINSKSTGLQNDLTSTMNTVAGVTTSTVMQDAVKATTQNVTDLQKSVISDVNKNIKGTISEMSQIGPGVGLDLGVYAEIEKAYMVGLSLQNLVYWPATVRESQWNFTLDTTKAQPFGFATTDPVTKTINYTASEPIGLKLGGAILIDRLTDIEALKETIVSLDLEQVFEQPSRAFAARIGLEKKLGPAYIRLGSRIGGIGTIFTAGLGIQGGPFVIDIGYGASNPFNPMASNSAALALNTSLQF